MSSFLIMISTCTSSQPYVTSIPRLKTKGQTNLLDENWFPVYRLIKKIGLLSCNLLSSKEDIWVLPAKKKLLRWRVLGFRTWTLTKRQKPVCQTLILLSFPPICISVLHNVTKLLLKLSYILLCFLLLNCIYYVSTSH